MKIRDNFENPDVQKKRDVFNYFLKLRNLDIKTLAQQTNYTPQTIYNALNKGSFSISMAKKLSGVLHCLPEELTEGKFSDVVRNEIDAAKKNIDYEIVSDDRLFMRTLLLSQQRTIENLSIIAKEKYQSMD